VEKRREELQRHYEHTLRERSPNEIFMFDTDTLQITYANDYALENLGYTLEQLQKKTILGLHPESGIEFFGARIDQLHLGKRESITYRTVQARENGSTYPVEVSLQLITSEEDGERFLAIVHDITALKQAEENIEKFIAPVERRGGKDK
jgi:PAS domain S-box-containing protein